MEIDEQALDDLLDGIEIEWASRLNVRSASGDGARHYTDSLGGPVPTACVVFSKGIDKPIPIQRMLSMRGL